jgi:FkbM family methyltransferase
MKIIDKILRSQYFEGQPPVLIDIGASGGIHAIWKSIASYSCCIAFDADDREFQMSEEKNNGYKRLIKINRIVSGQTGGHAEFYLTNSPYCSSLLEPDIEKLQPWLFKPLFEVKNISTLPSVTIAETLDSLDIQYIDWFKVDTQGTDLRIYNSLPDAIREKILLAEFEPGIMDAYKDEDKLYSVMKEMHVQGFWLSSMQVKGTQRLQSHYTSRIGSFSSKRIIKTSPCWAELTYFRNPAKLTCRSLLLMIVFALLDHQYGYALELTDLGKTGFEEPLIDECRKAVLKKIQNAKLKLPLILIQRKLNKLFSSLHA